MEKYTSSMRLRDVVADNALLLPALSRFGISLGFGDRTVAEVCADCKVHTPTFLTVANFISGKPYDYTEVSVESLVGYLRSAHSYFLNYQLPGVRRRIIEAVSTTDSDISLAMLKFFDSYVGEVRKHMEYENSHVFIYVEELIAGQRNHKFAISHFRDNHKPIASKLHELKELLICHFTTDNAHADILNTLLFDIVVTERDLLAHCRLEDDVFVPAVESLESLTMPPRTDVPEKVEASPGLDANGDPELTPRERDIVTAIARGLSNKEIADALFLSVHTVATHRRNICAKLNIHSASGMTIFALLHGLISMEEGEALIRSV